MSPHLPGGRGRLPSLPLVPVEKCKHCGEPAPMVLARGNKTMERVCLTRALKERRGKR